MATAVDADTTVGAVQIGILVSLFAFGLITSQTHGYFQTFPDDLWTTKTLVGVLWLLELAHCICDTIGIYRLTVNDAGNAQLLLVLPQTLSLTSLISGVIAALVQVFYALRIYHFSKNLFISGVCGVITLAELSLSFAVTVLALQGQGKGAVRDNYPFLITAAFALAVAVDTIIAVSLCYYFAKWRHTVLHRRTIRLIDEVMRWTIQTGLLTSVTAIACLICFHFMPQNYVWLSVFTILARLYAMSLVGLLNARVKFRRLAHGTIVVSADGSRATESTESTSQFTSVMVIENDPSVPPLVSTLREVRRISISPQRNHSDASAKTLTKERAEQPKQPESYSQPACEP